LNWLRSTSRIWTSTITSPFDLSFESMTRSARASSSTVPITLMAPSVGFETTFACAPSAVFTTVSTSFISAFWM
jgi:hypothetical protein